MYETTEAKLSTTLHSWAQQVSEHDLMAGLDLAGHPHGHGSPRRSWMGPGLGAGLAAAAVAGITIGVTTLHSGGSDVKQPAGYVTGQLPSNSTTSGSCTPSWVFASATPVPTAIPLDPSLFPNKPTGTACIDQSGATQGSVRPTSVPTTASTAPTK